MPDETQAAAEEKVADLIFGEEPKEESQGEVQEDEQQEEHEPDPEPVVEGEESEEEPESDMVEVEWEGQLIEAPKAIADALMRNKDYTEKTQDLAASRKEIEIQSENLKRVNSQYEFAQQVQGDIVNAHQFEQQIDEARTYLRENVDSLTATDITKIQLAISDAELKRDNIIKDVTNRNSEFQQAHEQTLKELVTKSTEVLRQKVPGWDDTHEGQIKDYALSLGVPEQTYSSVVDPVEKLILYKAMQYDTLKSGVTPAVKTVQAAPTIKPKSRNPMTKDTQDKLNLRKKIKNPNKSAQDKAGLIGMDIANRFNL